MMGLFYMLLLLVTETLTRHFCVSSPLVTQTGQNQLGIKSMVGLFYMLLLAIAGALLIAGAERGVPHLLDACPNLSRRLGQLRCARALLFFIFYLFWKKKLLLLVPVVRSRIPRTACVATWCGAITRRVRATSSTSRSCEQPGRLVTGHLRG